MKLDKDFIISTAAKGLSPFLPAIGGSLISILTDIVAERKQQRFNDFVNQLKADLDNLSDKINRDIVQRDEFLDIFELTAKKVMDERNEIKRLAYKNIIINGMTLNDSNFDDIEQCVRLIENTTEKNIFLLKVLSDPNGYNATIGNPIPKPSGNISTTTIRHILQKLLPGWEGGQILENLKDLEFLGLIRPISNDLQNMITESGLTPILNTLTLKGERFVKYLKQ